jgi:hypothetical protein
MKLSFRPHRGKRLLAASLISGAVVAGGVAVAAPAQAVTCTDVGASFTGNLNPGQCIHSSNNLYKLVMQGDGNLVSYRLKDSKACFSSGTAGHGGAHAQMVHRLAGSAVPVTLDIYTSLGAGLIEFDGSGSGTLNISVGSTGSIFVGYTGYRGPSGNGQQVC